MPIEFEIERQRNRRSTVRRSLDKPVQFEHLDRGAKAAGGSLGFDISEGGLRLRFNDYVPLGTELLLTISLAKQATIECSGVVVWAKKYPYNDAYQAGIQFEVDENIVDSRKKIHQYIESF